jgi:hypothetical protein
LVRLNKKEHDMKTRFATLPIASLVLAGAFAMTTTGAQALGLKDCSDKYSAAKDAGKLGGKSWNDFRKSDCGADAKPVVDTKPAAKPADAKAAAPKVEAPKAEAGPAPATTTTGGTVFPKGIDSKYASEKPAKQRMHTCLDQYKANKANNGNNGLKWIQKGGGYYSECNKKLKS